MPIYGAIKRGLSFLGTLQPGQEFLLDRTRGKVIKHIGGSVDVEMRGDVKNISPYTEVTFIDERRQQQYDAVPEDYTVPILDWKKKKDGSAYRAVIEERTYLIEKDGKKFVLTCGGEKLDKGTADACKQAAQTHCNRKPPAKITTDLAISICKRAVRLGLSVEEYCADAPMLKESGLDPDDVTPEIVRQAVRWQQERPVNAPRTPHQTYTAPDADDSPGDAPAPRQRAARTGTAPGKGGYRIFGFPSLGIIHWMGVQGFTVEQAQKVLHLNGVTEITDANVGYRLKAGKRPNGRPADLTPEQQAQIRREAGLEAPKKRKK